MTAGGSPSAPAATPLVEMRGVSKHFGGVRAVDAVDVDLGAREVVGLVGHNGAGKSTLIRILSGALTPDAGEIRIGGVPVRLRSPLEARQLGVETLYQELALAENLDATANLFLGRERLTRFGTLDHARMEAEALGALRAVNPRFRSVSEPVARLSGGERQSIAIARALHFEARVLVLDEPTAALGPEETAEIHQLIRRLRDRGLGIFLVSHDLHAVLELADRVCVLRNGRRVATRPSADLDPDQVLALMLRGAP